MAGAGDVSSVAVQPSKYLELQGYLSQPLLKPFISLVVDADGRVFVDADCPVSLSDLALDKAISLAQEDLKLLAAFLFYRRYVQMLLEFDTKDSDFFTVRLPAICGRIFNLINHYLDSLHKEKGADDYQALLDKIFSSDLVDLSTSTSLFFTCVYIEKIIASASFFTYEVMTLNTMPRQEFSNHCKHMLIFLIDAKCALMGSVSELELAKGRIKNSIVRRIESSETLEELIDLFKQYTFVLSIEGSPLKTLFGSDPANHELFIRSFRSRFLKILPLFFSRNVTQDELGRFKDSLDQFVADPQNADFFDDELISFIGEKYTERKNFLTSVSEDSCLVDDAIRIFNTQLFVISRDKSANEVPSSAVKMVRNVFNACRTLKDLEIKLFAFYEFEKSLRKYITVPEHASRPLFSDFFIEGIEITYQNCREKILTGVFGGAGAGAGVAAVLAAPADAVDSTSDAVSNVADAVDLTSDAVSNVADAVDSTSDAVSNVADAVDSTSDAVSNVAGTPGISAVVVATAVGNSADRVSSQNSARGSTNVFSCLYTLASRFVSFCQYYLGGTTRANGNTVSHNKMFSSQGKFVFYRRYGSWTRSASSPKQSVTPGAK